MKDTIIHTSIPMKKLKYRYIIRFNFNFTHQNEPNTLHSEEYSKPFKLLLNAEYKRDRKHTEEYCAMRDIVYNSITTSISKYENCGVCGDTIRVFHNYDQVFNRIETQLDDSNWVNIEGCICDKTHLKTLG